MVSGSISRHQRGIAGKAILFLLILLLAGAGAARFLMDWDKPEVKVGLSTDYFSLKPFDIFVSDSKSGVSSVQVSLEKDGQRTPLFSKTWDSPQPDVVVTVDAKGANIGNKPGDATLVVKAIDGAEHYILPGNTRELRKPVKLDFKPPTLEVLSTQHYVNQGGVGLVIYSVSDDTVVHGVKIGKRFFPGYGGHFSDPHIQMAYFAHAYDTPASETPVLIAEDAAGNRRKASFHYRLRPKKFRDRTIEVKDSFVKGKITDLLGGLAEGLTDEQIFIKVNKDMRANNEARIKRITSGRTNKQYWQGKFNQLSNSKVEANFADHRSYRLHGKIINDAWHLGYDLSVTRHYPVEAANNGVVVYADDNGIYGNTIIIDHGMGLYTLYGHMSSFDVEKGDFVKKKQIIGRTGTTGLAAGDHLHYGTYLNGVAVVPIEWWDAKWIRDNITRKIEAVKKELGGAAGAQEKTGKS